MNERIRELYEQARLHAKTIPDLDPQGWMDEYHKKFAELLIQECAELMKKESEEYHSIGSDFCDHKAEAFDEAIYLVKRHFGVE